MIRNFAVACALAGSLTLSSALPGDAAVRFEHRGGGHSFHGGGHRGGGVFFNFGGGPDYGGYYANCYLLTGYARVRCLEGY